MEKLTIAALEWWNLLSLEDKQNKSYHYCRGNELSSMEFEISHIVDIYKNEHPHLITSAEQLDAIMDDIFSTTIKK